MDDQKDEEVFIGKLTLEEVKKHISLPTRQTIACIPHHSERDKSNTSLRIIETHSAPNINEVEKPTSPIKTHMETSPKSAINHLGPNWDIDDANDSFLKIERMVSNLCTSPETEKLNTTERVVEYVLNSQNYKKDADNQPELQLSEESYCDNQEHQDNNYEVQVQSECNLQANSMPKTNKNQPVHTPLKFNKNRYGYNSSSKTPLSIGATTHQSEVFKTPGNPPLYLKKNTPASSKKLFHDVVSPVAHYIKNSPVPRLIKNVQPRKPISAKSSIPKPVKQVSSVGQNKENFNLPQIAYKTAKETKVIKVPEQHKLPQSQWSKQVVSSIPKAIVMKHNHREITPVKKPLMQEHEESFDNLTLLQADVSVCTQKSAFNQCKKPFV